MKQKLKFHLKNFKDQVKKNCGYLVDAVNAVVPSDTLKELEKIQMPLSKKELREFNVNIRILEKTCTWIFCHCLRK